MPNPNFNREKFLLHLVGWILGVQFGLFILAGAACTYGYAVKVAKITNPTDTPVTCPRILEEIKSAAGESLAVLLALLGGGTLAIGEINRRKPPDPPDDKENL